MLQNEWCIDVGWETPSVLHITIRVVHTFPVAVQYVLSLDATESDDKTL